MALTLDVERMESDFPLLDPQHRNVPLRALLPSARRKLAMMLDDESNTFDDWRGLAELAQFSNLEIKKFGRSKKPTEDMLSEWELRQETPTLQHLWDFLVQMERHDVLVDCKTLIERDARGHIEREARLANDINPIQEPIVSSTTGSPCSSNRSSLLTTSDIENPGGKPMIYDAYVCFNEDSNKGEYEFIKESEKELEQRYGIKLCIPIRDSLVGGAKYQDKAELIKYRCRKMIIIVTENFIHSSACDFQLKFAHSLAPGAQKRRLIPVLLSEGLRVPELLCYLTVCDYTKPDLREWFWKRLADSIKAPIDEDELNHSIPSRSSSTSSSSSSPQNVNIIRKSSTSMEYSQSSSGSSSRSNSVTFSDSYHSFKDQNGSVVSLGPTNTDFDINEDKGSSLAIDCKDTQNSSNCDRDSFELVTFDHVSGCGDEVSRYENMVTFDHVFGGRNETKKQPKSKKYKIVERLQQLVKKH